MLKIKKFMLKVIKRREVILPFMYILECSDKTLYTGSAVDLEKRIGRHNSGNGAKYTRGRIPVKLVYHEEFSTMGEALKREREIKKWPKSKKKDLFKE